MVGVGERGEAIVDHKKKVDVDSKRLLVCKWEWVETLYYKVGCSTGVRNRTTPFSNLY